MIYTNVHYTGTEINQYHLLFYCLVVFEGQRELLCTEYERYYFVSRG